MKKGLAEIVVIADRSGSMTSTIDEARNSINRLIDEQKAVPGEATFTFAMFDDKYERPINREDLKCVEHIGKEYDAQGMTALNDAVGKTLNYIGAALAFTEEEERPEKVIVAIITDGMENASNEFTRSQVGEMIKHQKERYNWEFLFFGADIDAFAEGMSLNIDKDKVFGYDNTDIGNQVVYRKMSAVFTAGRQGK